MVLTAAEFSNLEFLQGTTGLRYYKDKESAANNYGKVASTKVRLQ